MLKHDIRDDGWIITWCRASYLSTGLYAILLTPFPACPVDIVVNGCADVLDLLAVINTWGNCPVGSFCNADTDGNCAVDVLDLLAVNNAWGCSPCGESFGGGSSGPLSIEEVIAIVLESSATSTTQAEIIADLLDNWD